MRAPIEFGTGGKPLVKPGDRRRSGCPIRTADADAARTGRGTRFVLFNA